MVAYAVVISILDADLIDVADLADMLVRIYREETGPPFRLLCEFRDVVVVLESQYVELATTND